MKRGDKAMLKRGKKACECIVLHDHPADDPPFPAVTIAKDGAEWIVGKHELRSPEWFEEEKRKEFMQDPLVPRIIEAFNSGCLTAMDVANHLNVHMVRVLSKFRKAKRLGLLEKARVP